MATTRQPLRVPISAEEERRRRLERMRALHERPREQPVRRPRFNWSNTIRLLVGVWQLVSPLALGYDSGTWSVVISGALLALLAYTRATARRAIRALLVAQLIVGAWILLSAFWLHDSTAGELNTLISGAVVLAASRWTLGRWRVPGTSPTTG
jgi:hypothetical protein